MLKYLEGLCKSLFDPLFFSGRLPPPCFTTAARKGNARTTWEPLFLLSAVLNSCVLDSVSRRDAVTRADAHTAMHRLAAFAAFPIREAEALQDKHPPCFGGSCPPSAFPLADFKA